MTTAAELSPTVQKGGVTIEQLPDDYQEPVAAKTSDHLLSRIWNIVCEWFRSKTRECELLYYQDTWNNFNLLCKDRSGWVTKRQLEEINELKPHLPHMNQLD